MQQREAIGQRDQVKVMGNQFEFLIKCASKRKVLVKCRKKRGNEFDCQRKLNPKPLHCAAVPYLAKLR